MLECPELRRRPARGSLLFVALFATGISSLATEPCAEASSPDPLLAALMSAGSTAIPLAITASLWATGRGVDEGLRFDLGLLSLGAGVIVGPSVGQIYASGGVDAVVTFVLRTLTGGVMLVGVGFKARGGEDNQSLGTALSLLGGIPAGLLALYDIFGAASSARATRRKAGHDTAAVDPTSLMSVALCGPVPCQIAL